MKYNIGDKVIHNKWGKGVIVHADSSGVPYVCEFENETDNNFSFNGKGKEGYCAWCEEKNLKLAETKLYAYELMKLAKENPQEYEGKRYKVVRGSQLHFIAESTVYSECIVKRGTVFSIDGHHVAIFSDTVLEEIKPKPVDF